jgi:hypothetical protein
MLLREGRRVDLIHQKLDAIIAKIDAGASPIEKFFQRLVLNGKLAILSEGPIGNAAFLRNSRTYVASDSEMERAITWEQLEIDAGVVAYQLLQEVYHWFGISDDGIPYARKRSDGTTVIDPEELIKAGNL